MDNLKDMSNLFEIYFPSMICLWLL